jgi:hypothetical protein
MYKNLQSKMSSISNLEKLYKDLNAESDSPWEAPNRRPFRRRLCAHGAGAVPSVSRPVDANNFVTLLQGHAFNPTLGMGWILIDEHGIYACHIYLHVDEILVSVPITRLVQLLIGYLTVHSEWG